MTRIMEIQNKTIPYKKYKPNEGVGGRQERNKTLSQQRRTDNWKAGTTEA